MSMKLREHVLKILPEYHNAVVKGDKTFEIRKNDRDFMVGDWVKLLEFDGEKITGNYINARITYVTNYEQKDDYVVFSIQTYGFGYHSEDTLQKIVNRQSKSFNEYIDNYMYFEGKVLTHESILAFPSSLEQTHIHAVRHMLISEGYNPDEFKVSEIPICGVYYFEKANKPSGTDYFSVFINDQGNIVPQYSTKKYDKDGFNTFPCRSIKEAIEKNEC